LYFCQLRLKATTCSIKTAIETSLSLYDQDPTLYGDSGLIEKKIADYVCSLLYADLHTAGDYW
jgi:hypothetical protein